MLDTLKAIHNEILAQIGALERVVGQPTPCRDALSTARWRLMRASRARLKLLADSVYPALADAMPARIEAFRADDAAKRVASAAHIAHWNTERIDADWSTYQAVSAAMTAAMRRRIADEQRAFYSQLHRRELTPSAGSPSGISTRSLPGTPAGMPR